MDLVRELFRYHSWATAQLLDHCAELDASGTALPGSIRATFGQMLGAEGWALRVLAGDTIALASGPPGKTANEPSFAELMATAERQAGRWDALLARLDRLDVTLPNRDGLPAIKHAETMLVMQVLHEGEVCRAQASAALAGAGLPLQEADAIAVRSYWARPPGVPPGLARRPLWPLNVRTL